MEFVLKTLKENLTVNEIANVHFFEFQKEFSTKDDKHPFSELIFVSSGALNVSSEEYKGELKKGEMIIHPENSLHSLSCPKNNAPTVIIIGFKCNSVHLDYFANHTVKLNEQNVIILSEIVKEGRNVFLPPYNKPVYNMKKRQNQPFGTEQMLKISIERFLIGIIREYAYHELHHSKKIAFSTTQIIDYVDKNYLEKITIDELAFLFNTNRTTLCKDFKKATGRTLIQYLNDKKIATAKKMIMQGNVPFNEIAETLHFLSQSNFTRFFISQTGLSPKQFKEQNKT